MGSVILFFFPRFLIPLSRENKVICIARDGCTSDTGMYSSADGCIYGLCWPENSEKSALPRCPVLKLCILEATWETTRGNKKLYIFGAFWQALYILRTY